MLKKNCFLLLSVVVLFYSSCKTNTKKIKTITGNYLMYDNAAILQTEDDIYKIIVNEQTQQLEKKAQAFKKAPTDMVKATLNGIVNPKPKNEEGWPNQITITKIISVNPMEANANKIIKLGN